MTIKALDIGNKTQFDHQIVINC